MLLVLKRIEGTVDNDQKIIGTFPWTVGIVLTKVKYARSDFLSISVPFLARVTEIQKLTFLNEKENRENSKNLCGLSRRFYILAEINRYNHCLYGLFSHWLGAICGLYSNLFQNHKCPFRWQKCEKKCGPILRHILFVELRNIRYHE